MVAVLYGILICILLFFIGLFFVVIPYINRKKEKEKEIRLQQYAFERRKEELKKKESLAKSEPLKNNANIDKTDTHITETHCAYGGVGNAKLISWTWNKEREFNKGGMQMIKIVKGDLLTVERGIIAHQVNCMGAFNSGVAKQVREKYPVAFTEYKSLVDEHLQGEDLRKTLLGNVNGVKVKNGLYIANMFGQYTYGYGGEKYTNEEALFQCFKTVRKVSERVELPVFMPYMVGGYRGGGDWKLIEDYLLTAFDGYEVTLYKYHEG